MCIVSFPIGKAFTTPVSNLSAILSELYPTQVIIGSYDPVCVPENSSLKVHSISHRSGPVKSVQVLRFAWLNLQILLKLFSLRKLHGRVLFFTSLCPVFPMVFSVVSGKKIYWMLPSENVHNSQGLFSGLVTVLSHIGFRLSTGIILYSPGLITEWHLEPYRDKILIAHEHFIQTSTFTVTTPFPERPLRIGYIGRFSEEKGIGNFIRAIPEILNEHEGLRVFIGGDGQVKETVVTFLKEQGLLARVDLPGWIAHDDLPAHLNTLRLLVLPSTTEGLPNIMLEAMACGTPVLATPVGAVPDSIKEGETGFIMKNNSPECIAENINRALKDPNSANIALNGRKLVEQEFTFEMTVKHWEKVLDTL